jgi:hypothetical protein
MTSTKLLKADKKGKVRITGVKPLDEFYLLTGADYLLLKRIKEPSPLERFEKLAAEIQAKFKEEGIGKSEIIKAIKWARKK